MEQFFEVNERRIKVELEQGAIHIFNDKELWELLSDNAEVATDLLIVAIKKEYESLYGSELGISDASLAVEIWGHVYFEYCAVIFEKLVDMDLIKQLTNKITSYCEIIDCGESGKDTNRILWDLLSPFKKQIAFLLPKDIVRKHSRDTE